MRMSLTCADFPNETGEIGLDSVTDNLSLVGLSQSAKPFGEHVQLANIRKRKHICTFCMDLLILLCYYFVVNRNL